MQKNDSAEPLQKPTIAEIDDEILVPTPDKSSVTEQSTDEPPPKPKAKAKKKPTPHTLMKNALVMAMGYKQDDITAWGQYNKASQMLRAAGAGPDDMIALYAYTAKDALSGGWVFKSPVAMATRWPGYQKQLRQQEAQQDEPESKPLSATDGVIRGTL